MEQLINGLRTCGFGFVDLEHQLVYQVYHCSFLPINTINAVFRCLRHLFQPLVHMHCISCIKCLEQPAATVILILLWKLHEYKVAKNSIQEYIQELMGDEGVWMDSEGLSFVLWTSLMKTLYTCYMPVFFFYNNMDKFTCYCCYANLRH